MVLSKVINKKKRGGRGSDQNVSRGGGLAKVSADCQQGGRGSEIPKICVS